MTTSHVFSGTYRTHYHTITILALHEPLLDAAIAALGVSASAATKLRRECGNTLQCRRGDIQRQRKARKARNHADASPRGMWQRYIRQSQDARRLLRRLAGETHGWDVDVVLGDAGPHLAGHGFSFRWVGKWKGAPGSYQPSTHRIEVGLDWLREHYGPAHRAMRELADRNGPRYPEQYPYVSWSQELVRRLVADCGWSRLIEYLDAELVARTETGELWRIDAQTVVLRVRCPSTGSEYCLRVPPAMTDPETARRWTLGIAGTDQIITES